MNTAAQIRNYRNRKVVPYKADVPPPAPTPYSVPDHLQIVKNVFNAGHYDLSTRMGCGRFLEDATYVLARDADPKWGDLLKNPGQNHWQGHAVDNPLYLSSQPGQSTAVDIVAASESVWAALQWSPDIPRYSPNQWRARTTGDRYTLSPHQTRLCCTLMWALAGFRKYRDDKLAPAVDRIVTKYKGTAVRMFLTVGGDQFKSPDGSYQDPWLDAGAFYHESGHFENARDCINWLYDHGLLCSLDLVGSGAQASRQSERDAICDRACQLVETCGPQKFALLNMWNEYWATGGQVPWLQAMVTRCYQRLGHAVPLAMDSPVSIAETPTSEADYFRLQEQLKREMETMYPDGFNAPNAITPQFNRDLPNPVDMGPRAKGLKHISQEPRGVGTSGQSVEADPLPLVHDFCQCVGLNYLMYTHIILPGIWGGLCHGWTYQNRWPTFDSIPNFEWHEHAMASVVAGELPEVPTPGEGTPPIDPEDTMKARDQFYAEFKDVDGFYGAPEGLKRPGNMVIDTATPPRSDVEAMGAWGYDLMTGRTPDEVKHDICQSDEWKGKHPGETPPY